MDEEISSEVVEETTDPILEALKDTEDTETKVEEVVETKDEEVVETPAEEEPKEASEKEAEKEEQEIDPKEEARRRYEERERARAERRAKVAEQTKEYTESAVDEYDQRLRAMEVEAYNQKIENTENILVGEFERAKANPSLQMFNPESEVFNQRLFDKAIKDYNEGYIQYDTNNNPIGVKTSLYDYLTETAELFNEAVKTGQIKQVKDSQKMRNNSVPKPAATPKAPEVDPLMEILSSD